LCSEPAEDKATFRNCESHQTDGDFCASTREGSQPVIASPAKRGEAISDRRLLRRTFGASRNDGVCEWFTVYNGVNLENYAFSPHVDDDAPLMFLGRLESIKGPHLAIEVAKRTNQKLILAGNKPDLPHEREYFEREVEPHIDGKQIIYAGPVNDEQKGRFLGRAKALLFPIQWGEPFGIVMTEALACGTPVIAMNHGAVPEVIRHGETGFICSTMDDMISSVEKIRAINRKNCRMDCESRFSSQVIVEQYLNIHHA